MVTQGHNMTICAWKLMCFKKPFFFLSNFIELMLLIYFTLSNTLAGLERHL